MMFSKDFLATVATPSLLIDLATAQRNIGRAADYYAKGRVKLRPHFKAHKISALMKLQVAAGGCSGVTCATPYEAEVLADAGIDDILVANQIADPASLAALARAAGKKRVTIAIDCAKHVELLEATAQKHRVRFGVLIEIDVGMGRCGLNFGSDGRSFRETATARPARSRGMNSCGSNPAQAVAESTNAAASTRPKALAMVSIVYACSRVGPSSALNVRGRRRPRCCRCRAARPVFDYLVDRSPWLKAPVACCASADRVPARDDGGTRREYVDRESVAPDPVYRGGDPRRAGAWTRRAGGWRRR